MENTDHKANFSLEILTQDWLGDEPAQFDLCSHGEILLTIGGQLILDGRASYGLSESALALLRTLDQNHSSDNPLAEKLVFHGCGTVLMHGCPIGVDWDVKHAEEQVTLNHIRRWDWPDENRPTEFAGLQVTLPLEAYRQSVLAFADQVRKFFEETGKVFFDESDRLAYQKFWQEFHQLSET